MGEFSTPEYQKSTIREPITWEGKEYIHFDKTSEWFWSLGLIAVAGAVTSLVFKNLLFAIFILIAAFVLAIFAARRPEDVTFTITQRGVLINTKLYPFQSLSSFSIEEIGPNHIPKLILEAKSIFVPNIIIPLDDVDIDHVHDFIFTYLPEGDHEEPLSHKIMEWLGF